MKVLFQFVRPHLLYFIFAYLIVAVSSISILAFFYELRNLVDLCIATSDVAAINNALLFLFSIVLIVGLSSFLRLWLTGYVSEKVILDIRIKLYNKIIHFSPRFFENNSISSLITRLMADTATLQVILSTSMSTILRNTTTLLGSVVMLVHTNVKLTMYTVIITPIILIILAFFGKKVKVLLRKVRVNLDNVTSFVEETCRGIYVIQSFSREDITKQKFSNLLANTLSMTNRYIVLRALLVTLVITLTMLSIGFVLSFGIREVLNGNMTVGSLFSFIFYAIIAASSMNNMGDNFNDIQKAVKISEDISKMLLMQTDIIEVKDPYRIQEVQDKISINNVTFYYPSKPDNPALKNVSFTIEKGQVVALVGPSGSGKSTIVNILLRFYDVNIGNITIDGMDIKKLSLMNLRSLFSIIPQSHIMFSGTIWDNITYGVTNAEYEDVRNAAKIACILDFVESLPDKFDSLVGERGLCLSEGQKQRIAIARAVLKDSGVLVLDEATSSLDSKNEQLIHDALDNLRNNRTILVIAHRLSTILKADKIIVFNNGCIDDIGTHKSLMQKPNGLYAKLAKLQLSNDSFSEDI
ncbi:ABC transporter family protein [Ehrlichia chaffeensis str. Heartland]|uniref:ABC transporter ATP-binding protein n=1 Tax=Ehrlichia chaffeensis TaxID=945 RepID=UPI000444D934|nr:ABC transporter transmembrane domain-containing protein [Ehrlichia chaffeensis]AHX03428.1 ABC transporter family protein [Ehrlichia chaffeensis str. Heartland]AHX05851.1 ABC transporter family protein [Ehrlichia chaffeensis str. Jax]AHX08268.1 ABC transporter family protein [Ehrlichia chaffeensis str. Saint Vincent]AHX10107.1 ABC transporter family protein [Ehrlichia chaffeensis str. West Paces]